MIIFCVMVFGLMLAIGGLSFDLMRYETHRKIAQSTLDRAVLAAASITQKRDPKEVVLDYFEAAGMADYIDANDIVVTERMGTRKVEAVAHIHVPLHHGAFKAFTGVGSNDNTLIAKAHSVAGQVGGDVEVSLVLDVSDSMKTTDTFDGQSRLAILKDAAQSFVTTTFDALEDHSVAISVIPYTAQVSTNAALMSHLTRTDSHEHSFCLNFNDLNDFSTTAISPDATYEQTLHFGPEFSTTWGWSLGEPLPMDACPANPALQMLPWETDEERIIDHIEGFETQHWTSIDIGAKWGAAMLDPSFSRVASAMIADGDLSSDVEGHPVPYGTVDVNKFLVIMTDGTNSFRYRMSDFRSGNSFIWKYEDADSVYYSIWHEAHHSTPDIGYEADADGTALNRWLVAYNSSISSGGATEFMWQPTPYDDADATTSSGAARRLTWDEVWAEIPMVVFSRFLGRIDTLSYADRYRYGYAVEQQYLELNDNLQSICQAAKDQGVVVFTIGLEASPAGARYMERCATSTSHFYHVESSELEGAFNAIAVEVGNLKLLH